MTFSVSLTVCESDSRHARFLADLNDPDSGVVSVRIRPGTRRIAWVAKDILSAVGVRHDVAGKSRNGSDYVAGVPVWLTAHDVGHLVVTGVEALSSRLLSALIQLAACCGVSVWLVTDHELPDAVTDAVSRWPTRVVDRRTFDSHRARHLRRPRPAPSSDLMVWPDRVPDADFPVFLADVHAHMSASDAALVDATFRETVSACRDRFDSAGELGEELVTSMLRDLFVGRSAMAEVVTVVRAFQAAVFTRGWFVQVDFQRLLATGILDRAAVAADPETWRLLRAYRQPYRAAVCALFSVDVSLEAITKLRVGDVDPDGSTVSVDGVFVAVPPGAEVFVRALRFERLIDAASSEDLLVVGSDGEPMRLRRLANVISDAGLELGLALAGSQIDRQTFTGRMWRTRFGVSVQSLGVDLAVSS